MLQIELNETAILAYYTFTYIVVYLIILSNHITANLIFNYCPYYKDMFISTIRHNKDDNVSFNTIFYYIYYFLMCKGIFLS